MGCQQSNIILYILDYIVKLENCNENTLDFFKLVKVRQLIPDSAFVYNFPEKNKNPQFILSNTLLFLDNDDLIDEISVDILHLFSKTRFDFINNRPLTDLYTTVDMTTAKQTILKLFKTDLPKPYITWTNWKSNETLTNFAFSGLGQYYLQKTNHDDMHLLKDAAYKIDQTLWNKYNVRTNYEKYGICVYFDEKRNPLAFVKNNQIFHPNHPSYDHMNFLFRSTIIMIATLSEHLIGCHWIIGNSVLVSSMQYLSSTHILRRFLRCHTYGSASINLGSTMMLAQSNGLACRLSAFDTNIWDSVVSDGITAYKYETIEEHFTASNLLQTDIDSLPYYKDGIELWNINKEYVNNFINIYYLDDNAILNDIELVEYWQGLKNYFTSANYNIGDLTKYNLIKHLTHYIFTVTAQHTYIGGIIDYVIEPDGCAGKVLTHPNITTVDFQTYMQQLCLAALTHSKTPQLISNWAFLYDIPNITSDQTKYNALKVNLNMWQYKLVAQAGIIDKRNTTRFPFMSMNPIIMDSSVSL